MIKIRFLKIQFDTEIEAYEIPAFRGAVIAKAGNEHIIFHNHLNDREFLYGYPVIQYKRIGKNPAIICIDYGVEEIHHLFNNTNMEIVIGQRPVSLVVKNLQMQQYNLQVWEKHFEYRLYNWLALNQENYEKYQALKDELSQTIFLENILKANIISFAKGVKWDVDKEISLRIDELIKAKIVPYKQQKLLAFDIRFRSNVFLPDFVGLGKGVSLGFGTVSQIKNR
ncbi:CRISPR-associated endonuclease Cas6 [Arcicella sp. LKC2W]|uniref:CRISPR-associated endonuclease Cas6 n=1 Tax=Arcicella sp. LKC2W TaxID=2984198 RepID=UPI002B1FD0AD|nr:CRISPR-associated endonuclease Cas6 [Arcicella sp. LKC2W]MEA5461602.1 CRISPR-associated endonuclease Cas6 [Arcicella sp. LKC2W]